MRHMKYVILDGYLNELPILFPPEISHDMMSKWLSGMGPVVSAGFVDLVDGQISAHGESQSLGLKSRPQDSTIIESLMS
jgi:hypothetical protein